MIGRWFRSLELCIALLAVAIAASAIASPAQAAKRDNSIRVASYQVADIIDPYFNTSLITTILAFQIWDTLVYRDPKTGEFKGALAASWKSRSTFVLLSVSLLAIPAAYIPGWTYQAFGFTPTRSLVALSLPTFLGAMEAGLALLLLLRAFVPMASTDRGTRWLAWTVVGFILAVRLFRFEKF